jgi:hypothetical protein
VQEFDQVMLILGLGPSGGNGMLGLSHGSARSLS